MKEGLIRYILHHHSLVERRALRESGRSKLYTTLLAVSGRYIKSGVTIFCIDSGKYYIYLVKVGEVRSEVYTILYYTILLLYYITMIVIVG